MKKILITGGAGFRGLLGYDPQTKIEQGIEKFVEWFHQSSALSRRL